MRDAAYFESATAALEPAVEEGRIAFQDFRALKTTIEELVLLVGGLRKSRKNQGLIHADLHRGNFIYGDGRLSPIDFSFCAFGHFAFDLSICLANISPALHPVFVDHYERFFDWPHKLGRLVEAFFIGGHVATFALWVAEAEAQEALAQRVPYIAREFAARFNRDERFLLAGTGEL